MPRKNSVGDGGSASQKRALGALPDAVRATKKSSKQVASGTTAEKGAADKDKPTTNRNLAQGKESNAVRTATSYFDPVWNTFSKHTDGSMQWIPKQIVAIGEDFHSQVGEGKVRTTLYKVRWEGYDKKDDTWEPITHLQGYATMVKAFKESHAKDVEKLAADRVREAEKKAKDNAASTPKHTVLSMTGLTSAVWTLGMFEMVSGESCQCIHRTKQKNPCDVAVRHAACTVPTCGFVVRYQNTSNLEQHYIRGGPDHKELADRLAGMQQLDRQEKLASGADGRMVLSRTFNAPAFTAEKKALCDMKFVKWLVRKSRALTMGRQDDELNEFIEEVTDGAYTLPCYEVILKLVKQMQAWGDARIKKIVQVLAGGTGVRILY